MRKPSVQYKATIYKVPAGKKSRNKRPTYTIHETEGAEPITVWLPPNHSIGISAGGYLCIECPDGSIAPDLDVRTARNGLPSITHKTKSGYPVKHFCSVLSENTHMRIVAYKYWGMNKKKEIQTKWSIRDNGKSEPVLLYLPSGFKLVETSSKELRIQLPETFVRKQALDGVDEMYVDPAEPVYVGDFSGVNEEGLPYLRVGKKHLTCHPAHEDDVYKPSSSCFLVRINEQLWRKDETLVDRETCASRIRRKYVTGASSVRA